VTRPFRVSRVVFASTLLTQDFVSDLSVMTDLRGSASSVTGAGHSLDVIVFFRVYRPVGSDALVRRIGHGLLSLDTTFTVFRHRPLCFVSESTSSPRELQIILRVLEPFRPAWFAAHLCRCCAALRLLSWVFFAPSTLQQ